VGFQDALTIFAPDKNKVLSREVHEEYRKILKSWGILRELSKKEIVVRLLTEGIPNLLNQIQ